MATKKSGLGKGIDALFVDNAANEESGGDLLRVSEIQPRKDQPRREFAPEALQSLADSIRENGLLQPIVVRESPGGFYEIICGERRWRAAKLAGLTEIPARVLSADDRRAQELALIENVQREDLNPMEVASAYRRLREEYGLTQEQVSSSVGKSRSSVANSLRLLDLPVPVQDLVASGALSEGHAKVLLGIEDPEKLLAAAQTVVENDLSVRASEALVRRLSRPSPEEPEEEKVLPVRVNYVKELEVKAGRMLGRKVGICGRGKTKRIELYYEDKEDLESLLERLCGRQLFEDGI